MNKLKYFFIAIVLGISAFTHLYRIDQTYIFNNDEGRDALIAYRMIETGSPVLLGPETSVGNMYLGPFYYYLMVPALMISGLDPVGPAIMVSILGIITTILIIYLGKKKFSLSAGIVAGLFYALSPIMVFSSRSSWNPNVIPLFITLLLLVHPAKKLWQMISFGLLTGIIFQLHYVALIVPALLGVQEFYLAWKNKEWKHFGAFVTLVILGFLVASSPFWLFEIRHNFINSQAFITYLMSKSTGGSLGYPPYLLRLLTNGKLLIGGLIGSKSVMFAAPSLLMWAAGSLTLLVFLISKKGTLSYLTLFSLIIISVLKENIYIHYISFLYPVICAMIAVVVTEHGIWKIPGLLLLLALVLPSYASLHYNLAQNVSSQPRRARETADYIVKEASGKPYNVVNASTSSTSTILYFLAISNNPPKNSDEPLIFVICEKDLCGQDILTRNDLFLNGPSHPTLISYLGYTPRLTVEEKRTMLKNEWVTYDVHVATVTRDP
jgi:4-amino-4-deoxy-L-arabinose transferase-like glycosyltransferase